MRPPRPVPALLAAVAVALTGVVATGPARAAEQEEFVVRLVDPPLASYRGGLPGLAPTNPGVLGQSRLDPASAASRAYLAHLDARVAVVETGLEAAIGRDVEPTNDYRYAFNGFSAQLSPAEAATLRTLPGVADVQAPIERELLTDAGPEWIGAPAVWTGEAVRGPGTLGEGVVVGVVDTGINHDHPSFADVGGDGYDHDNPRGTFYGLCDPVTGLPFCNDKLIGVWDFTGTTPEDDNQHGSHTAGTSVGNRVDAVLTAPTLQLERPVSGVAPHANLITYKACIAAGCLSPSLVAAIDQATADRVDVINYSIGGGSSNPWADADALAFLGARDAGVFVATSAGNSGPGPQTIGSPADAPWVTSVAAATHDRAFTNALTGATGGASTPPGDLVGRSLTGGYGPATVVHAADHGDELCSAPFPPGTFDGEIVVCRRGVNPRVEKANNVAAGGAGGMVLVNTPAEGESAVADAFSIPAVALGATDGARLEAWVRDGGTGHTASIAGTTADRADPNGDVIAGFSSRGANPAVPGVLKPDVAAPGVDVLAAVHTTNPLAGPEFGLLSGTSMSSPHVAGAAALVLAAEPRWTPGQVQSALMTTAVTSMRKDDAVTAADPFDMGAGRVDLTRAARAGLLLDETRTAFDAADPALGGDPRRLNLPSMADADCAATCSWARTVTNVLDVTTTWNATAVAPAGMAVSVKPSKVTLAPGQDVTLTVTADVSSSQSGSWRFAEVRLSEKKALAPAVHLPVAALPGGTPVQVSLESAGTSGSHTETLQAPTRMHGATATVKGLQQGVVETLTVTQDPTPLEPYDGLGGTVTRLVQVGEGSPLLAAEIAATTANDLDLFVGFDADGDGVAEAGEEVCRSASETALERCAVPEPKAGTYWVMVQDWLTGQVVDSVDLVVASVPGADAGNLAATVGGGRVAAGESYDVSVTWDEPRMTAGTTWFGLVEIAASTGDPAGNAGSLLVRIDRR